MSRLQRMRDRVCDLIQLDSGALSVVAIEVVLLYLEDTGNKDLAQRLKGPLNYRIHELKEQDPEGV